MAKTTQISTKRIAIDKANAQLVAVVAVAAFISIFSLVAAKSAFSSNLYQQKVYSAKSQASKQLDDNLNAWNQLASSYKTFDSAPTNVIQGSLTGTGDNDGSNSKIIRDALPSTYDYPALTSSIEKIIHGQGLPVSSITGTDDQLNQQSNTTSPTPAPVPMPFSFSSTGIGYTGVTNLINALQNSIRPMQIDTLDLTGGAQSMDMTVSAHTYYQPGKSVNITQEVVK